MAKPEENCPRWRLGGATVQISGRPHRELIRGDGFRLFLDPVFLCALQNRMAADLPARLVALGAATEEIPMIIAALRLAGLADLADLAGLAGDDA
ncbi:hypothetical protein JW905_07935 [bacterium]|nr:hypothetical protein [candidate division CSSED10-310 bacterium]